MAESSVDDLVEQMVDRSEIVQVEHLVEHWVNEMEKKMDEH